VLATGVSAVEMAAWIGTATREVGGDFGTRMLRLVWRAPAPAPKPAPAPRKAKPAPILLDDALEEPATPEARKPPPIIREPERRPEPAKKARRFELQEEL